MNDMDFLRKLTKEAVCTLQSIRVCKRELRAALLSLVHFLCCVENSSSQLDFYCLIYTVLTRIQIYITPVITTAKETVQEK